MPGRFGKRGGFRGQVARWTAPRQAIYDCLSREKRHVSAKDIYAALRNTHPDIGLTTVYRTLDLLFRSGVVDRVSSGDGHARYELKTGSSEDHHHHLICTSCGLIVDYMDFEAEELEFVRKTEAVLSRKYDFQIRDHNIEFIGLCGRCRKHKGENP